MKLIFTCLVFTLFAKNIFCQNFTPGNLVVFRAGSGAAAIGNIATAIFLDEYTTTGTLVQTVAMPTMAVGANKAIFCNGSSTTDGQINLSADKKFIVLTGYLTTDGAANPQAVSSLNAPRVIGTVANDKIINTTTSLDIFSAAAMRSVASPNGTDFYVVGGSTGTILATLGSTTTTLISGTITNSRAIKIFDGDIYISNASGTNPRIGKVGTGLPTTTGQVNVGLPGMPTTGSPYSFLMLDVSAAVAGLDVLYIADDGFGILKYSLVGGSWVSNGTINAAGVKGLTGSNMGNIVKLYSTDGAQISTITDNAGYNAPPSSTMPTVIATAAINTAIRGIAFAPESTVTGITNTTINNVFSLKKIGDNINNNELKLNINTKKSSDGIITIFDVTGRLVFKNKIKLFIGNNIFNANIQKYNAGTYILNVTQLNKKAAVKFFKF